MLNEQQKSQALRDLTRKAGYGGTDAECTRGLPSERRQGWRFWMTGVPNGWGGVWVYTDGRTITPTGEAGTLGDLGIKVPTW